MQNTRQARVLTSNEKLKPCDAVIARASAFTFAGVEHVCDYFLWRQEDAHRNALNSHCYWTLRKDGLDAKTATRDLKNKSVMFKNELLFQHGINYDTLPSWQKRGIGFWYEEQPKIGFNPVTKEKVETSRRVIREEYELPIGRKYAELITMLSEA